MMHVQKNNQVLPFSQMGYHIIFLSLSGLPRVTQSVKRKIRSYIVHLGKCHEFKINAKLFLTEVVRKIKQISPPNLHFYE